MKDIKSPEVFTVSHIDKTEEWKCLYRLEIPASSKPLEDIKDYKIFLSLFGTVKNPTSEDWKNISLSLVANDLELLKKVEQTPAATQAS